MNPEKLKKLEAQVRIGGKGTPRRKKKVVHSSQSTDDKKLQSTLKKLSVNNVLGIDEVNMIRDDGTVLHFDGPNVQACFSANTFAITGHPEESTVLEMLPDILSHLGANELNQLTDLIPDVNDDDEDVPDLVENFDEASKNEGPEKETPEN